MRKHNAALIPYARTLRKNMTEEERKLWYAFLRTYPVRFTRQKILGMYIADFYCARAKLVIELDGSQHYEIGGKLYDMRRDVFLSQYDLTVLRIPNNAVRQNFRGVCEQIELIVKTAIGDNPSVG